MEDIQMADEEYKIAFRAKRHFHNSYNAPYLPQQFCIRTVLNFSWDGCNTEEK